MTAVATLQAYHPSTVLLSKQVLLCLSPLHHQVLPPPEVAHLLPSSFAPAVGKALMQQVLLNTPVPVMAGYEHKHARLHMWHVWWHVGLRRGCGGTAGYGSSSMNCSSGHMAAAACQRGVVLAAVKSRCQLTSSTLMLMPGEGGTGCVHSSKVVGVCGRGAELCGCARG